MSRHLSFVVWGVGGHGKMIAELVCATGHGVVGLVDQDEKRLGRIVDVLGEKSVFRQGEFIKHIAEHNKYPDGVDACALGIGNNRDRLRGLELLKGLVMPSLIHPSASVSPSSKIGRGTVVLPKAVINVDAVIMEGVIVNTGSIIEHDCIVERGAHVSPGAVLCGGVRVEEGGWIGAGATVIPNVRIGRGAVVGAGATVINDVPEQEIVFGVPARPR